MNNPDICPPPPSLQTPLEDRTSGAGESVRKERSDTERLVPPPSQFAVSHAPSSEDGSISHASSNDMQRINKQKASTSSNVSDTTKKGQLTCGSSAQTLNQVTNIVYVNVADFSTQIIIKDGNVIGALKTALRASFANGLIVSLQCFFSLLSISIPCLTILF